MENERRIDRTTSMGMDEHRLSDILHASQIKATDIYETPPQIIWIDNSTIATLGNFSASTGKAKSKKTFNVSALVAASLAGKQVLNYRAHLPEGKQRILYVDTEQSRFHCRSVLERILRLAGLPTTTDPENLDFFCLREYSPSVRIEVIDYALRQQKGYGLVHALHIREKEFKPFAFTINETGLPVIAEVHSFGEPPKPKARTGFTELSIEQHREALSAAFGEKPIRGFDNLLQSLMVSYEAIGFKRGRSVMIKLMQYLIDNLKLIIKRDKLFYYDMTPTEAMLFDEE